MTVDYSRLRRSHLLATACLASIAMLAPSASAQSEAEPPADDAIQETIIITGSRGAPRSVTDSPVPVDVLSETDISAVSFVDTNDVLRTLVPSYSLGRAPISDGATFIRPASLRGLPTDKTLVLVNSKRRHRAALVAIGGSGTQGPDVATIPASALKSVEVLRDGAAAQYGSDAIAGVINFLLKDDSEGGSVEVQYGQYYEEDGEQVFVAANKGFALADAGFVNLSVEYSADQPTFRGEEYCETFGSSFGDLNGNGTLDAGEPVGTRGGFPNNACVQDMIAGVDVDGDGVADLFGPDLVNNATGEPFGDQLPDYPDERFAANVQTPVVQPWGQPTSEAFRTFVNAGYTFSEAAELYGFANYSLSEGDGSFFYRYPGNSVNQFIRLQDGTLFNAGVDIYPAGFTPRFFGKVIDYSATGGLKGDLSESLSYDLYARYGRNEIQYTLENTINPSLGPATAQSFRPGDLISDEFGIGGDLFYDWEVGLASPLTLAFGGEFREEGYELVAGAPDSYEAGPFAVPDPFDFCTDDGTPTADGSAVIATGSNLDCANPDDPVYTALAVGSNGFPGYPPEFTGDFSRDSYGIYVDASADVTEQLFLQAAARFEDYSDFGTTSDYKLAGRYEFTPNFAVRGSVGTGFRAPTPGQLFTTNVSTRLPNGVPVATGLFPASSPAAQALGAEPLAPEESVNYTLGLTSSFDSFTLTVDFYQIELTDRLNAVSTIEIINDIDDPSLNDGSPAGEGLEYASVLAAAGVANANTIGGVNFFQNAFDTTTMGVDVVATYLLDWGPSGTTNLALSANYNEEEFDGDVSDLFNAEDQFDLINGDPKLRGTFTATHAIGSFTVLGRANYYGEYENAATSSLENVQTFGSTVQIDLEATWQVDEMYALTLGARNIFDEYPDEGDRALGEICCGRIYRSDSEVDWQGGFYYARLRAEF